MPNPEKAGWQFIDNRGTFELLNPEQYSYLYFPLLNEAGMMSCITPRLNGDAKTGQNSFLLTPVSVEDLHNNRSGRNFWVKINGEAWSLTGNSAYQEHQADTSIHDQSSLRCGLFWHCVTRIHNKSKLVASVTNFVPANGDTIEIMHITLNNQGNQILELEPTAAIPIYGRSAENLRDHRHVTALFHQTSCHRFGVVVKPSLSFDERGHSENKTSYAVLGFDESGNPPQGFIPLITDFIGEGGCLDNPQSIISKQADLKSAGYAIDGYESIGGLCFPTIHLKPGETKTYILLLGIFPSDEDIDAIIERYGSGIKISAHFEATKEYWEEQNSIPHFDHGNNRFDGWLKWVSLQPTLRRIMGNSFLPYHDYGKGGRGWRDLWQDLLAPLLSNASDFGPVLIENFAGVRMDGSHATIVGHKPGEFFADRNRIPRVWMDHGAWPLLTVMLYLDLTGDLALLIKEQTYFKDHLTHRCQNTDNSWYPEQGTYHRTANGDVVYGTVLEHLLVEHLTSFFNVGEHNFIKLEGGDWNDGLDMAAQRGESVAFSAFYAGNLRRLSDLCKTLSSLNLENVAIHEELLLLLDRVSDDKVDYHSIEGKQARLSKYLDRVAGNISGKKVQISLSQLSGDLFEKAEWLSNHIRQNEWINDRDGFAWFNGYYDNLGNRVEGDTPHGIRMTLTGQVFPLMAGIATSSQSKQIADSVNRHLYDQALTGYRLNTEFTGKLPDLGRAFLFAYGHKENGSIFSHMNVMYAYALYKQGLAQDAWRIMNGLYKQSQDFSISRIYPGIPEYFDPRGRGLYPYLTGSAAWFVFTLLTESFGIKGRMGDLIVHPKLVSDQFSKSDQVKVSARIANKRIEVTYHNPRHLSYGEYHLKGITVNGVNQPVKPGIEEFCFPKEDILTWQEPVKIFVELD